MRKSRTELEAALARIESKLAAHPLASDEAQQTNAIVEAHENNADNEAVQRELTKGADTGTRLIAWPR